MLDLTREELAVRVGCWTVTIRKIGSLIVIRMSRYTLVYARVSNNEAYSYYIMEQTNVRRGPQQPGTWLRCWGR